MKHVGQMKNNGAKIVIAYRTIPGDPHSALVIGTSGLGDIYHDALMSLVESDAGQQADEFADILAVRRFPDNSVMLNFLHNRGFLRKVPTNGVYMTPTNKTKIPLDELNGLIAEQLGVGLSDLAIKDGVNSAIPTIGKVSEEHLATTVDKNQKDAFALTPMQMRARADALYKEASSLRKKAEELDPTEDRRAMAELTVDRGRGRPNKSGKPPRPKAQPGRGKGRPPKAPSVTQA